MTKPELRMFTDSHTEVSRRIDNEQTFAFKNRVAAEDKARELSSYVYELYARTVAGIKWWGYGVPK